MQLYNKNTFIQLIFRSVENWLRGLVFNGYQNTVFAKYLNSSYPQKRAPNLFSLLEFRRRDLQGKAKVVIAMLCTIHSPFSPFSCFLHLLSIQGIYLDIPCHDHEPTGEHKLSRIPQMPVINNCFLNSMVSSLARLAAMPWACQWRVYPDNAFSG